MGEIVPANWQNIIQSKRGDLGSIATQNGGVAMVVSTDTEIRQSGFIPDLIV